MSVFIYWKEIYDQQWYFQLKDNNNRIILTSTEGYKTEQECFDGIASVQLICANHLNYEKFMGADYKYYFKLRPDNSEPIARSEGYNISQARDTAIGNCSIEASNAVIRNLNTL